MKKEEEFCFVVAILIFGWNLLYFVILDNEYTSNPTIAAIGATAIISVIGAFTLLIVWKRRQSKAKPPSSLG